MRATPTCSAHSLRFATSGCRIAAIRSRASLPKSGFSNARRSSPPEGAFDREAFQRDALAKREYAPQYYLTLASRPVAAVKKLELVRRAYELLSSDVGYMARYGEALWMAGRHDDAVAMFDQAMRADRITTSSCAMCARFWRRAGVAGRRARSPTGWRGCIPGPRPSRAWPPG